MEHVFRFRTSVVDVSRERRNPISRFTGSRSFSGSPKGGRVTLQYRNLRRKIGVGTLMSLGTVEGTCKVSDPGYSATDKS
jgi:hypothetical protein